MKYIIAFDSYVRIDNKAYDNVTNSSILRLQYVINTMIANKVKNITCKPTVIGMVGWEAYIES